MGDHTGIAWCDSTLNLWLGCTQLSPACDHCYAMAMAGRVGIRWNGPPKRTTTSWTRIELYQRGAARFMKKHGRRRRVFINSMSDFFDKLADQSWRDEACPRLEAANDVIWILVTKRPQNVRKRVPAHWLEPGGWPAHIWLLVTAENIEETMRRVPYLLSLPVPMPGLSMEPLLETIRLPELWLARLKWIIVGGESGPGARPMPEHADELIISDGLAAGVAMFMKQRSQADFPKDFEDFEAFPPEIRVREWPDALAA